MPNLEFFHHKQCASLIPKAARLVSAIVFPIIVLLVVNFFNESAPAAVASSSILFQGGTPQLTFTPTNSSVVVGTSSVVTVSLDSVTNLYGYQFQVQYDATKVSATAEFVNSFFDTSTNAFSPGGWNAVCASGVCSFAATKQNPGGPVTGSGPLARITFTGVNPGSVPLTFNADILADRNGIPISHTTSTGTLDVYGAALVTGTIALQGRTTPITAGTVTLTDSAAKFMPTIADFDSSTGTFSATVPVDFAGSSYHLDAAHSLYLVNRLTGVALLAGNTYTISTTTLKAGDANNDGTVDILDLSCVGGSFRSSPSVCGTNGSSDINADGTVDILDLVLIGGNYRLSSPQPW